ncbi:MAG: hypothetical protein AAGC55_29070, partial [Myxococcota bacterium]
APDHLPALRKLGELYRHDRRYRDAAAILERVVGMTSRTSVLYRSHLELAELYRDHLDKPDRALDNLSRAIEHGGPDKAGYREALTSLANLQLSAGDEGGAAATAVRMVEAAPDEGQRADALIFLAELEMRRGELDRAERALAQAVALSGPDSDAAERFRDLIVQHQRNWTTYTKGLIAYIQRTASRKSSADREILIRAYIELARTHSERMGLPRNAIANLEEGIAATGGDPALARQLIPLLRDAGRYKDAFGMLRELLGSDLTQAELWRDLVGVLDQMKETARAEIHLAPLVVLGAGGDDERKRLAGRTPRTDSIAPGAFSFDTLRAVASSDALSIAGAELLGALADGLGRIYPPDFDQYGLSKRDRITARSRHPLRLFADRLAALFEIEYELYIHAHDGPLVSVEMTEPASIIVAGSIEARPEPEKVFLLAYAMVPIAGRFYPADRL